MDAQQLVKNLQNTKEKNLAFFSRYAPNIYNQFKDATLKNSRLNIDPNSLEVNLIENGELVYPLNVREFNTDEAQQFSDAFREGSYNHPLARSNPDELYRGRYSHASLANFLDAVQPDAGSAKPYVFKHSLPQVVFLGSGLGLHIQEFLKIRAVKHITLVENNADRFLASMYLTDWEELITPYLQDPTKSFVLSVADTTDLDIDTRIHQAFAGVWNHISVNVPFMPTQTVYYIHQGNPFYTQVANRLNDEILSYTQVWGYYDDEINQLNHVMHNLERKLPILKKIDLSNNSKATIVCGNGPSLDSYIPLLKKYREKLNIIAAGSATHSLLKNDIYPDFMATLESDYETHQIFELMPETKKKVKLIAAAQVSPKTFDLFSDAIIFIKNETTLARFFEKNHDTVELSTPSATNTALALAIDLKMPNIFLIGTDYGFKDKNKTHSNSSFYHEDDKDKWFETFKKSLSNDTYFLESNNDGDIYTTPFYNTCREYAQRKILNSNRNDIINLSTGADIKGAPKKDSEYFIKTIESMEIKDEEDFFQKLILNSTKTSRSDIDKISNEIIKILKSISNDALKVLKKMEPNLDSIENVLYEINKTILTNENSNTKKINYFIRGSIWLFLFNFYALCKEIDADKKLELYTNEFKHYFGGFLSNLSDHARIYISDRNKEDIKLKLSVMNPEPNIDEWNEKIKNFTFK